MVFFFVSIFFGILFLYIKNKKKAIITFESTEGNNSNNEGILISTEHNIRSEEILGNRKFLGKQPPETIINT